MKGIFPSLRAVLAAASLLGLAACGGSSVTNVTLGGNITGLTSGTLVLSNGLSSSTLTPGMTSYVLPGRATVGLGYGVGIVSQPADLTCTLANASGIAEEKDINNINVTCATNNSLGGTVTGLTAGSLVLVNGRDNVTIAAGSTTFAFPTKIVNGTPFGITILTQPVGKTCTVTGGIGTMGTANITSVAVNCI